MREEYDIDSLRPRKNPIAKELKKQITIKITPFALDYFKEEAERTGVPYQTLIDMYLVDCANNKKHIVWATTDNRA